MHNSVLGYWIWIMLIFLFAFYLVVRSSKYGIDIIVMK